MRKNYNRPCFLAVGNAGIDLTHSQEGAWGTGEGGFDEFWYNNEDDVLQRYPGFNPGDSSTWPSFFDPQNEDTWWELIE